MNTPNNEETQISIVVDKKHNTTYCINPNGRSYIKTDDKTFKGEKR